MYVCMYVRTYVCMCIHQGQAICVRLECCHCCQDYAEDLIHRVEMNYRETDAATVAEPELEASCARPQEEATALNSILDRNWGSFGHPELCNHPCMVAFHGNCRLDATCNHCHMAHENGIVKLDKRQREVLRDCAALEMTVALLPVIQRRLQEDQARCLGMCRLHV